MLNGLMKLLNQAGNAAGQVNNATYGTALNAAGAVTDVMRQIPRAVDIAKNSVLPSKGYAQGQQFVKQASDAYRFDPAFNSIVSSTHPTVRQNIPNSQLSSGSAGGQFLPGFIPRIDLKANANPAEQNYTVLHEGLHAAWDKMAPQDRQQFNSTYDMAARQKPTIGTKHSQGPYQIGLNDYMNKILLSEYKNKPANMNVPAAQMPESIQTELQSYLPKYYQMTGQKMPQNVAHYYNRFYRASDAGADSALPRSLG